jgi:hypothetical protein
MDAIYEQLKETLSFSTTEKTDQLLRYKKEKDGVVVRQNIAL